MKTLKTIATILVSLLVGGLVVYGYVMYTVFRGASGQ